jgi:arylsulfatase A-like enzyme
MEPEWIYFEIHEGFKQAVIWNGQWKGIKTPGKPIEVFDVKTDIQERKNLAKKRPDLVQSLEEAMIRLRTPSEIWPAPWE